MCRFSSPSIFSTHWGRPASRKGVESCGEAHAKQPPEISGIGIFTAGRPALLERALSSNVARTRSNQKLEYIVFDDSKGDDARRDGLEIAQRIQKQFNLNSLPAARIICKVLNTLQVGLPVQSFFEAPPLMGWPSLLRQSLRAGKA